MFKRGLTLLLSLAVLLFGVCTSAFAEPGKSQGKNVKVEVKYQTKDDGFKVEVKGKEINYKKEFKFKDVSNHWAVPQIKAMYMQGIISGYPDFTFQPEKSVTKNEALLMVCRAVGFDKDEYDDTDNEWNNVPDWMQECISFAVDEGIITENEANNFKGNTPAKRYEVAVWAGKAAGLDAYTDIKFADLQDIPYFARPYIGSMYRCEYINGYPGNLFQPNKPIKRAEIATIIFNMLGDFDGVSNYRVVKGIVEDIDLEDETITVETTKGNEKIYDITDDTEIFINSVSADLDDVEEGVKVVLYLNSKDEVLYLYAREVDEDNDEELTVEKFVPADDEEEVNPSISELKVKFNQAIRAVEDLENIAKNIEIEVENDKDVKISSMIDEDDLEIKDDTLIINVDLDYDTKYTVTIDDNVIRAEDSRDIKNDDIKWTFITEEEEELVAEKFYPGKNAKNVDPEIEELKIWFNQNIKEVKDIDDILNSIRIVADNDDETTIDVEDVEIDEEILIIKLDDDDDNELDYDTKYTVTIDDNVIRAEDARDIKNDDIKWAFTTEEEDN